MPLLRHTLRAWDYIILKCGDKMTVYADILILVNFIVDYFLLQLSAHFSHKKPRLWRLLTGALAGGIFSLYIFLPETNFLFETFIHILMCALMCLIAFGIADAKDFFRNIAVLFAVNFAYSGAMIAVWYIFRPSGLVINNSVVYFDISPLFLILFSVIGYFGVTFLRQLLAKTFPQNIKCEVAVYCQGKKLCLCGIADTGNSLRDVFGMSQIFITDADVVDALLGAEKQNPARYRVIPCGTIAGEKMLDGYRIDHAEIYYNKRKHTFKNPVLAISHTPLDDCRIIINPETLN